MKKIVITGALGHIGSHMCRALPEHFPGVTIHMVDDLRTQRFSSLFDLPRAGYRFWEIDVLEAELEPILEGASAVLHLAAITDAAGSFEQAELVEKVNFNATRRVAEAAASVGCPMIHLSSTSVYGTAQDVVHEDDEDSLKPQSPYAETKLREERLLARLAAERGLRHIVCRFGTIAGASRGMRFHTAVNKFCWQTVFGSPLTVWATALDQKRPYLDLTDAGRAVVHIVKSDLFDSGVYNVLTANHTVRQIVGMIEAQGYQPTINLVDARIMNQLSYEVATEKFVGTGFEFSGSIADRVAETLSWLAPANGARG